MIEGSEVIENIRKTYSELNTYVDEGSIQVVRDFGSKNENTTNYTFRTWYKKPKLLKYQWSALGEPTNCIVFDGKKVWSKKRDGTLRSCGPLEFALDEPGIITVHELLQHLLLQMDSRFWKVRNPKAERIEKCKIDNEDQFRLHLKHPGVEESDAWLTDPTLQVRRTITVVKNSPAWLAKHYRDNWLSILSTFNRHDILLLLQSYFCKPEPDTISRVTRTYDIVSFNEAVASNVFDLSTN